MSSQAPILSALTFSQSQLPPVSRLLFTLAVTVLKWEQRRQTRRALRRLDGHQLADIGITTQGAEAEAEKPFWRD